jgi:transcriptional regulator with XRE-family HTH domain
MENIPIEIGRKIKVIRELRNFSQAYVADKMGMSQASYSCLESCKTKVSPERLKRIAEVLLVSEEIIFQLSPETLLNSQDLIDKNEKLYRQALLFEKLLQQKDEEISLLRKRLDI